MLRRAVLYSCKPQYANILFIIMKISGQHNQMSHLSYLPCKPVYHKKSNLYSISNIYDCIFQHNFRFSCSEATQEIKNLSESILSGNSVDYDNEAVKEINKIITFLLSKGYTKKDIKAKFSPYLNSADSSYTKITLLSDIGQDILLLMPLTSLPLTVLRIAAKIAGKDKSHIKNFPDRIMYLSHHLELEPCDLVPALTKHSALLTMQFKRLDHKMNILKSANISSKYIVKDLWIFNYNEQLLTNRVRVAVKAGMELKPWMLRCSESSFESMLIKHAETQRILGGETTINYLAKKLKCSEDYIEFIMEKNKMLKSINIPKLEQMIDFLLEKGYTAEEIRLFPRVFCSSVETLNRRFEMYHSAKSTLPTISQLSVSSKNFDNLLKKKSD